MPHRRPRKKGSFGGHLDELLKQFDHEPREESGELEKASEDKRDSERGLFERSWRKPHERRGAQAAANARGQPKASLRSPG